MNANKNLGEIVDVAGYDYTIWAVAPGPGKYHAFRRDTAGRRVWNVIAMRGGRWAVVAASSEPKPKAGSPTDYDVPLDESHHASHGEMLKEEGMARALSKKGLEEWQERVRVWAWHLDAGQRIVANDIIEMFGTPSGGTESNKNNAVGAIMNGLAKKGVLRKTGEYAKSSRPERHGAIVAVWERTQLGKEPDDRRLSNVSSPHIHVWTWVTNVREQYVQKCSECGARR